MHNSQGSPGDQICPTGNSTPLSSREQPGQGTVREKGRVGRVPRRSQHRPDRQHHPARRRLSSFTLRRQLPGRALSPAGALHAAPGIHSGHTHTHLGRHQSHTNVHTQTHSDRLRGAALGHRAGALTCHGRGLPAGEAALSRAQPPLLAGAVQLWTRCEGALHFPILAERQRARASEGSPQPWPSEG